MRCHKDDRRSGCSISLALDILGDRWTLLIIRDLMFHAKRYYTEFLASEEKIATNILADRLKRLEDEGIVSKRRDPDNQKKFIYHLTEKGIDLLPILLEMALWGAKYVDNTESPKELISRLKKDRDAVIKEIMDCIRQAQRET
ncbi:MAG: helix-turn-helix domain-containing protein [Acidobacteriota bacterium]